MKRSPLFACGLHSKAALLTCFMVNSVVLAKDTFGVAIVTWADRQNIVPMSHFGDDKLLWRREKLCSKY